MASSTIGQTLGALRASRERADRMLELAAVDAARIERQGVERAREQVVARLREVEELRAAIAAHAERVELAASHLAETMAAAAATLVEVSAETDFSPPAWADSSSVAQERMA